MNIANIFKNLRNIASSLKNIRMLTPSNKNYEYSISTAFPMMILVLVLKSFIILSINHNCTVLSSFSLCMYLFVMFKILK